MSEAPYPYLGVQIESEGYAGRATALVDTGVPAYLGTVELTAQAGRWDALIIALGDEYLIGLAMVNNFRVTFDHGQRPIVDP